MAALSALVAAAPAEAAESGFIARFLGVEPSKTADAFACFNRVYDPAHLAQHPQQNVKTMMLLAVVDPANADEVQLRFGVAFRTRKGMLETNGGCAVVSGEGDAAASHLLAEAFSRDPAFFAFYRAMESYKHALAESAPTVVLAPDSELLKFFNTAGPAGMPTVPGGKP